MTSPSEPDRRGVALGVAAYVLWGLFPPFFRLLEPAAPVEVLAHRVIWTLVFMAVVLAAVRGWGALRTLSPRGWAMVTAAAVLIAVNWGLFIYAVGVGHVVEVALGYFIGPLVSVLLGVVVLHERLRRLQWVAVAIAAVAVLVIAVGDGRVPWLGLGLAVSFATYGLIKKTVPLPATASLTAEGVVLAPLARPTSWSCRWRARHGDRPRRRARALLMAAGPITAVPLLLYGASARRIPLSVLGTLQYIAPTLQFLIGVVLYGEAMPAERWVGFGLVWLALAVFTVDLLRSSRPRRAVEVPAEVPDRAGRGWTACRRILVRRPSPRLADGELTHLDRAPVDPDAGADASGRATSPRSPARGWAVAEVEPADEHPDGVFVEDTVVVVDDLAVLTSPGAASRRGRGRLHGARRSRRRAARSTRIEAPGTLDGGDVLEVGRTVYVGPRRPDERRGHPQLPRSSSPAARRSSPCRSRRCCTSSPGSRRCPTAPWSATRRWWTTRRSTRRSSRCPEEHGTASSTSAAAPC